MGSDSGYESLDPVSAGIRRGLGRAAGVKKEDIEAWLIKLCGEWGKLHGNGGGDGVGTDDRPTAGA